MEGLGSRVWGGGCRRVSDLKSRVGGSGVGHQKCSKRPVSMPGPRSSRALQICWGLKFRV